MLVIFLKGFVLGFTLSSFFLIYKYKGLVAGLIYIFPNSILNIIATILVGVYSIIVTICLWKIIFIKDRSNNLGNFFKKYLFILFIAIIMIFISSICEGYLVPALLKLVIKLFI